MECADDVHISEIVEVRLRGIAAEVDDTFASLECRDHAFKVRQVELVTDSRGLRAQVSGECRGSASSRRHRLDLPSRPFRSDLLHR